MTGKVDLCVIFVLDLTVGHSPTGGNKCVGTVDPASKPAGEPLDWVRPSMNSPQSEIMGHTSPVSINTTQKSQKSSVGSPASGSPPIPSCADLPKVCPPPRSMPPTVSSTDRSRLKEQQLQQRQSVGKSKSGMRNQSSSGGVQVVLDEAGSWSDLADKSSPTPRLKSSGMLGFFSKRKGRASSPKPQERGVLGREGARVVIA